MTQSREQSRVERVRTLVRLHLTTTFFLLTFLITWVVWVPNVLGPCSSLAGTLAAYWTSARWLLLRSSWQRSWGASAIWVPG